MHSTAMGKEKARIHGMNLPPLVALRESTMAPMMGSFTASQILVISSRIPTWKGLTCRIRV